MKRNACTFTLSVALMWNCAGYANELGESFRHMVPVRLVHLSYVISSGYVLSHALSQGLNAHRTRAVTLEQSPAHHYHHSDSTHIAASSRVSSPVAFLDTLLWQGLASVLIPGLVINRVCAVSRSLLSWKARHLLSSRARKWMVTGIGISAIPVIIHPIDR